MKDLILILFTALSSFHLTFAETCTMDTTGAPLSDMGKQCVDIIKKQINEEINASMKYLSMGVFFSQDKINRPGFAKFFFESSSEERQHAFKFMEYLLMRGESFRELGFDITFEKYEFNNTVDAFVEALKLEKKVTGRIQLIMAKCEKDVMATNNKIEMYNDYHAVDYIINEFLDEQYQGQRKLAGIISELKRIGKTGIKLGEFLYDKTFLKEA